MQHPVNPSSYDYTDPFGSMLGRSYPHTGSDYGVAYAEVYSVDEAEVYHTGWSDGNGNYVTCYLPGHDWDGVEGGAYIAYIHLSSINTQKGARLKQGEKLGVSGNSGSNSRGPHLHITLSNSDLAHLGVGAKVDPWAWIQARLAPPTAPKPPTKPTQLQSQLDKERLINAHHIYTMALFCILHHRVIWRMDCLMALHPEAAGRGRGRVY